VAKLVSFCLSVPYAPPSALLDDIRYIPRKLSHRRSTKLENDPATWQVLFFRVSYPLGLLL